MIIFDNNSQANFAFVNFDEYDEAIRSYNITISFVSTKSRKIISIFFIDFYIVSQTNSLFFKIIDSNRAQFMVNVYITKAFYEKRSDSNKRLYIEEFNEKDSM